MVVTAVCVFGWVSYQRLSLTLMPDITYPSLTVRSEFPGTAPQEVESLLTRPLEEELGIMPGLVRISSISRAGQSDVILEFQWDADINFASQEIRELVDRVRLTDDAERPLLLRYDPSQDPILRAGLSGPQSLFDLRELADEEIKRELESISGVAAVKVKGGLEEQIHVELDEKQIALLGLNIEEINQYLSQGNLNLPGGNLSEGQTEYLIRTLNEFRTIEEIAGLIVSRQAGVDIRLRDIARVFRSHEEREVITRVNGHESVEIEIYKEADANVVTVARLVNNRIYGLPEQQAYVDKLRRGELDKERTRKKPSKDPKEIKKEAARLALEHLRMTDFISYRLPVGARVEVLSDQSVFISSSIREVQKNAIIGGLIATLVLFVFLRNPIQTLIVGLTIPVSIIAAFAPMYIFDVSLNIMSLGGLALGVGMLVDNSIVVLESIFRCREEGDGLVKSTVRGVSEVGSAVVASTLTTITVFFPIVFVEGVAGQVFGDMALTVVFSLLASLLVALFFIPMLASRRIMSPADGRLSEAVQSSYLRLPSLARLQAACIGKNKLSRRLIDFFNALLGLFLEFGYRLIWALTTVAAVLIKSVAVLLGGLLGWLLIPFPSIRNGSVADLYDRWIDWSEQDTLGTSVQSQNVWSGLLVFTALGDMITGFRLFFATLKGRSLIVSAGLWLGALFVVLYLLLRFLVSAGFRFVGSVLLTAGLFIVVLVLLVLAGAGALLLPLLVPILVLFARGFSAVDGAYPILLRWSLRHRAIVVMGALGSFVICVFGLVPRLGTELIPKVHQAEFNLDVTLPVGTPLEQTARILDIIEQRVRRFADVRRTASTIGSDKTASSASDEGEHTGTVTVSMNQEASTQDETSLIREIRLAIADLPGVEVEVSQPALFSFKTPIEVEIRGYGLEMLQKLSFEIVNLLNTLPTLADVKSTMRPGNPELQVIYDRERLAQFGLNVRAVAELVSNKVRGSIPTEFRQDERQIGIFVRLQESDRLGLEELRRIIINPAGDIPIPLSAVARIEVREGPSEIRRIDRQRTAVITANTDGVSLSSATASIYSALQSVSFPSGFSFLVTGQSEEMKRSLNSLYFALALAILLVYIVMACKFESLIHPFVIMLTVPLGIIGVALVLYLAGIAISVVVFIGLIMLAGIVVNNAIVMVDYINRLRDNGEEKLVAIMKGGSVRLRPILMTTATTVLGLLPMALGAGEGSEIRAPMAITVIAGLISSTFLTLVVIPTVYAIMDRRP